MFLWTNYTLSLMQEMNDWNPISIFLENFLRQSWSNKENRFFQRERERRESIMVHIYFKCEVSTLLWKKGGWGVKDTISNLLMFEVY